MVSMTYLSISDEPLIIVVPRPLTAQCALMTDLLPTLTVPNFCPKPYRPTRNSQQIS